MDNNSLYESELLAGDYHPRITAYYFRLWKGFSMSFHQHNAVEIMYVIEGECVVETETENWPMKRGDYVLLDAGVPHRLLVDERVPCRMLNLEFGFQPKTDMFPSIREMASEHREIGELLGSGKPYIALKDANEVYAALKALVLELDAQGPEVSLLVHLQFAQLLIRVAQSYADTRKSLPQQADLYVRQAAAYMHSHYDRNLQVQHIAAAVNVHPGYLHRIFKNSMGCTIIEYLTAFRMDKAKMLLAQTDIPIAEIAHIIGMNSSQYFSSVFRRRVGQTPLEYRHAVGASYRLPSRG